MRRNWGLLICDAAEDFKAGGVNRKGASRQENERELHSIQLMLIQIRAI